MFIILSYIQNRLVGVLGAELINAKQSIAVDLCPLRPPAHYLVTDLAEGRLKPLAVPLVEATVNDETTMCLVLESSCRMLMMPHFWYSRWWHHLEIRLRGRGGQLPNKGSKSPDGCQKKIWPDFSTLKICLLWHVIDAHAEITWQCHENSLSVLGLFKYVN